MQQMRIWADAALMHECTAIFFARSTEHHTEKP